MKNLKRRLVLAGGIASVASCLCSVAVAASDEMIAAAKEEGKVVFYSSLPTGVIDDLTEGFNALYPEISVEFYRAATTQMATRINAEVNSGVLAADVLSVTSPLEMDHYREMGILASYESPEYSAYAPEHIGPDNQWFTVSTIVFVLGYNPGQFDTQPTSWLEMTNPKHKGAIGISDPRSVGGGSFWRFAMWKTFGEDFVKGIVANDPQVTSGIGSLNEKLISGELDVSINYTYRIDKALKKGASVAGVYPEEGAVPVDNVAGVIANSEHPNAARLFLDFLASQAGQQIGADNYRYSLRSDVTNPDGVTPLSDIKAIRYPVEQLKAEMDQAQKAWGDAFGLN